MLLLNLLISALTLWLRDFYQVHSILCSSKIHTECSLLFSQCAALAFSAWPKNGCTICSVKTRNSFAYLLSVLCNLQYVFIRHIDPFLRPTFLYRNALKVFFAFEWQRKQRMLDLHCGTLGIDSSSWHCSLPLYYNCSPGSQIMQTRSILLWAKVTSKCKISQALRDKQDQRQRDAGEEGVICRCRRNIPTVYCPWWFGRHWLCSTWKSLILIWLVTHFASRLTWLSPLKELSSRADAFSLDRWKSVSICVYHFTFDRVFVLLSLTLFKAKLKSPEGRTYFHRGAEHQVTKLPFSPNIYYVSQDMNADSVLTGALRRATARP